MDEPVEVVQATYKDAPSLLRLELYRTHRTAQRPQDKSKIHYLTGILGKTEDAM